jgi:hypothetical protein
MDVARRTSLIDPRIGNVQRIIFIEHFKRRVKLLTRS